jgi:hypothetical protein
MRCAALNVPSVPRVGTTADRMDFSNASASDGSSAIEYRCSTKLKRSSHCSGT